MTSPQFLKRPCRPRDALAAVGRAHPDAWRFADELRAARGAEGLPYWPDWCYMPIGGWLSIASRGHLTIAAAREASILAALGAWRVTIRVGGRLVQAQARAASKRSATRSPVARAALVMMSWLPA